MRPIWWFLIGAGIMFIVLKLLSKGGVTSNTSLRFKELALTPQATNLIKTNEFRELVKTNQFVKLVGSLAEDEIKTMSQALMGTTKTY